MKDFEIGKIINVHGIKGELKVYPMTDDEKRFEILEFVNIDGERFDVEAVRYHKGNVLLKLKGIDDINVAEKYKNKLVTIPEDKAMPLEDGEYYIRDLYDMEVYEDNGKRLGVLTDVMFTAANDVYEITMEDGKKVLLPNIPQCILNVDVENKKMIIKMMEGLM